MELLLLLVNAAACGAISLALLWAILSPRVHDGVVIKVGLICMALGFGAIAVRLLGDQGSSQEFAVLKALAVVNAGIAIVIVGYVLRKVRRQHPVRRSTDWGELDTQPHQERGVES